MSKKVPYLETSPVTYQQTGGNGSSNTGCPTPTGNRIAAILQPQKDSSSLTEVPLNTPWDDGLEQMAAIEYNNFTKAANLTRESWAELTVDLKLWHMQQIEKRLVSGGHGEKDLELLQFWNQRIPVLQK
jgi:hypothetical protein